MSRGEDSGALVVTPRQADSRWYRRAVEEELDASRALDDRQLAGLRINRPEILAYRARMMGGSDAMPGYADWTSQALASFGPRRSCLSLGSGVGRVESYLLSTGFACSFDAVELSPVANRSAAARDERIGALSGDLNFVQLPDRRYDFILCHGILHHLINLEHVLHQIDRALTPDGVLLVYEYVGENRWQFARERCQHLEKTVPGSRVRVPPRHRIKGFESVRSGDLLRLLQHQFGERCERRAQFGGLYFPFVVGAPSSGMKHLEAVLRADEDASMSGAVQPCYHMGVYRKTGNPAARATPWTDAELRARLCPDSPIGCRAVDGLRRSPAGPALRRVRRAVRGMAATVRGAHQTEAAA